jgi:hypothetical protein
MDSRASLSETIPPRQDVKMLSVPKWGYYNGPYRFVKHFFGVHPVRPRVGTHLEEII